MKLKTFKFIIDDPNYIEVINHKTKEIIGYIEPVNKSFYQFITCGKIIFNTKTLSEIITYLNKINKEGVSL